MNEENSLSDTPIDLAREPDFALGTLQVSPSSREVSRAGWRDSLEPRVMQVLVALHQADGAVVSRDALIDRCWEGRVVGEDAINRAIGRLRRLSEADGCASFEIETIPRVGYRLKQAAHSAAPVQSVPAAAGPDRRWLVAGAGAATLAAGGAGAFFLRPRQPETSPSPPPQVALLLEQAKQALRTNNAEANAQAAGMFEHITKIAPDSAEAWGGMALALSRNELIGQAEASRLRAEDALRHARALDPHNAYAYAAATAMVPLRGGWARKEAIYREGLRFNPGSDQLLLGLAELFFNVGRNAESADLIARANALASQPDPSLLWRSIQIYWCAGRLAEADAAASQGAALFPRQPLVWFSRVFFLMYTGRTDQALAMLASSDERPTGQTETEFEALASVVRALKSKTKADIDQAMNANLALAHTGAGYAENTIAYAAAMGRLDTAFLVADGLYMERGFKVGPSRFSPLLRITTRFEQRRTRPLFYPSSRALWHDPRFAVLMEEIGLARYWKEAGVTPDYQRAKDI